MAQSVRAGDYVRIRSSSQYHGGNIYVISSIEKDGDKSILEVVSIHDKDDTETVLYSKDECRIKGSDSCQLKFASTAWELQDAKFLRPRGDKATVKTFVRVIPDDDDFFDTYTSPPPPESWNDLKHGDIIRAEDSYRGSDTWVVLRKYGGSHFVENTADEGDYIEINTAVTKHIEDPIDFYQGVDIYETDIETIKLDARYHGPLLQEATGGKVVDESVDVQYAMRELEDVFEGELEVGMRLEISIPKSPDNPEGGWATLNVDTPDIYLTGVKKIPYPDPVMEAARENNRFLHGVKADQYFRGLIPGDIISFFGFPEEHGAGGFGSSGDFEWTRPETGPVEEVSVRVYKGSIIFRPRQVSFNTGPYGGVSVWAGDNLDAMPRILMIEIPKDIITKSAAKRY